MLLNSCDRQVIFLCLLLGIDGITALARVDNNWSHRRPNITVSQDQWGQAGYRPVGVGYQQPLVHNQTQWQRSNQTFAHNNNQQHQLQSNNNGTQFNQPVFRPSLSNPSAVNSYKPQQPSYGQGALNQTRSAWQQPIAPNYPQYPAYGQGSFNQTRPAWQQPSASYYPQNPAHGQGVFNQTRPAWQQPAAPNHPQYPAYGQGSFNQTRPVWQQPSSPNYPQNPAYGPGALNQTRPAWPQPASPQKPNYPQQLNQTHPSWLQPSVPQAPVYPSLPNRPAVSTNSWTLPANQTKLYPQLPTQNLPQLPPAAGNSAIPLAPLQPVPQSPQGPHNWHSGGQAVLSYGSGYYHSPTGNSSKNPPTHQGSSNPYANMFN